LLDIFRGRSIIESPFSGTVDFSMLSNSSKASFFLQVLLPILMMLGCHSAVAADEVPASQHVRFETTEGNIVMELDGRRAPLTVGHVLELIDNGYYNDTIFHRVIPGFMIQGGGYTRDLKEKDAGDETIPNESGNGLPNLRGTVAMARLPEPH